MARQKSKQEPKEEVIVPTSQPDTVEEQEEVIKEDVKVEEKKETKSSKPKPYIHINTFLQTARIRYDLTNPQVEGFKIYMEGSHYQTDMSVFLEHLLEYFQIDEK